MNNEETSFLTNLVASYIQSKSEIGQQIRDLSFNLLRIKVETHFSYACKSYSVRK